MPDSSENHPITTVGQAELKTDTSSTRRLAPTEDLKWLTRRSNSHAAMVGSKFGLRAWARHLAVAPEESLTFSRLSRVAADLKKQTSRNTVSIGVTSPGPGNHHSETAIGLATLWARWDHYTVLIDVGGKSTKLGRSIRRTTPSIADLIDALHYGRALPAPQLLTSALDRLDTLVDLDGTSLARLGESGTLSLLASALRQRYHRIVWSLPPLHTSTWSVSLMSEVIDHFIVSARRAKADRRPIERLARDISEQQLPPVQLVWHR